MAQMLAERYWERLSGVLSCYDRIVTTGTLLGICYAAAMTSFLYAKGIRIFDYARFAEPLCERAEQLAAKQLRNSPLVLLGFPSARCAPGGACCAMASTIHSRCWCIRSLEGWGELNGADHSTFISRGCGSLAFGWKSRRRLLTEHIVESRTPMR